MPRYSINYHDKWACFTSISDGFITPFMEKSDYEEWRKWQYGVSDYQPAEECNMKTIGEAVFSIRLNRSHEEALECLLGSGLPAEECEKLLYDMETYHYCPNINENGDYVCPNCGSEVEKGQVLCTEDTCELEFVWRE